MTTSVRRDMAPLNEVDVIAHLRIARFVAEIFEFGHLGTDDV